MAACRSTVSEVRGTSSEGGRSDAGEEGRPKLQTSKDGRSNAGRTAVWSGRNNTQFRAQVH
jgi:hypothetical protein